jgi:hypothetical protein
MRNVKKGDKVKFLNDIGGGVVSKLINENTALVLNEDGFDMPVPINELIVIEEAVTKNQQAIINKEIDEEIEGIIDQFAQEDIDDNPEITIQFFLALVPTDRKKAPNCAMDMYLINDGNAHVLFNLSHKQHNTFNLLKAGLLAASNKLLIATFEPNTLHQSPDFLLQCIFYKNNYKSEIKPISKIINIHPQELFDIKNFVKTDFFVERAMLFPLTTPETVNKLNSIKEEDILTVKKEKEKPEPAKPQAKPNPTPEIKTIDLHIHELVDDETGLSDKDKLDLQIIHFRRALDEAIKQKDKKIIFIHGKGQGRLKQEIRRIIDKDYYPNISYQDASFQEYGFGATMVILK